MVIYLICYILRGWNTYANFHFKRSWFVKIRRIEGERNSIGIIFDICLLEIAWLQFLSKVFPLDPLLGFFEKFLGTRNTRRRLGLNGKWRDLRMGESDPEGGTRRRKEGGPLWKDRLSFAKALKRLRRRSN